MRAKGGFPGADARPAAKRHVMEIEGIGPAYARRLEHLGIRTIGQLWKADVRDVADFCGVAPTMVRNWRAMGELIDVRGVGPQFAELLVRSGVHSVSELANQEPAELILQIAAAEEGRGHRIQRSPIVRSRVESWIEAGRQYMGDAGPPVTPT